MQSSGKEHCTTPAGRDTFLGQLLQDLDGLPESEVWRVRIFAGLRRIVHEQRLQGASLVQLFDNENGGPAAAVLPLLDAPALAMLGASCRQWRNMSQWFEHWFLLGVRAFGKQRRLVPPGRFECFDEAMLESGIDWHARYRRFIAAAHCPSIESLRLAAVRVVQQLDLETSGVEEVRRRLAEELRLGQNFLSLECVEQLLEDAACLRSVSGRPAGEIER